jgi:hypothetical protein
MTTILHAALWRRKFLIGSLIFLGLAGCDLFNSPGSVAFERQFGADGYAIDLQRGFSRPVMAGDVTVFKQGAPHEWNRVQDPAVAQRMVNDFNANPDQWREMPDYREQELWFPQAEPPLM